MKLVTAGLLCVVGIAGLSGAALAQTTPDGRVDPEARFRRLDRDGDGRLSREEFPQRAQRLFERLDADRDGYVTLQEDRAARQARTGAQQQAEQGGTARPPLPTPDFADVSYGPHERNAFDLWLAESEEPTPLVIFFHGGGFRSGDKRNLQPRLLRELLRNGISVAAANYRLTDTAPYPAQMQDAARAVQFLRHRSREYNVDSERFAATGGSAGAGISQWLLFHDDLADAESEDPIARESTRLTCAVATAAQSSYDPRYMMELFGSTEVESAMWAFYGMDSRADLRDPEFQRLFEEASPINHATADDPPLMLVYPQANDPLPPSPPGRLFIHHPKFGIAMKEKLDELGVDCVLKLREDYPGRTFGIGQLNDTVAFFVKHLKPGGRTEPVPAARRAWRPQGPVQD